MSSTTPQKTVGDGTKTDTIASGHDTYSINWAVGATNQYVWNQGCVHHAIPKFDGFKKISGPGPQFIKVGPGPQLYGCFEGGAGRNFYGSHDLVITKL